MADNLARAGDDSVDEDPSLDSILNRLNSLGGSADHDESAPALRGVPDLPSDDETSGSESVDDSQLADRVSEPVSLSVVTDEDTGDSPFRSQGLFGTSSPDQTPDASVAAATVASSDDVSSLLKGNDKSDDDAANDVDVDAETADIEEEAAEAEEQPERIDYFADLHAGEASAIAGVPTTSTKRAEQEELELDPGYTVEEAFTIHPEQPDPKDIVLTDTHGLLADPLDIKDIAPPADGTGYEEHFSHGVQFPEIKKAVDPSDPIHVDNPFDDMEASNRAISLKPIISVILLLAAIAVLYFILSDSMAVDDIREGVEVISE